MIKQFYILIVILSILIISVVWDYMRYDRAYSSRVVSSIGYITGLSSPSLSVSYYEPRVLMLDSSINTTYPQMMTIDRMDFIYAN